MKYDIYPVKASDSDRQFEFVSEGPKGKINKLIAYKEYEGYPDVYNLGFGDVVEGVVNDVVVSNNGDSKKVLRTVASTIPNFFDTHQTAIVLIFGTTQARSRLYRMMISNNLRFFKNELVVFGLVNGDWYLFDENFTYDGFMIRMKTL
jgi:hypothetical protein